MKGTLKELAFSLVADELVAGSLLDDELAVGWLDSDSSIDVNHSDRVIVEKDFDEILCFYLFILIGTLFFIFSRISLVFGFLDLASYYRKTAESQLCVYLGS